MDDPFDREDTIEDPPSVRRMRQYAFGSRQNEAGVELLVRSGLAADEAVLAAWGAPGGMYPDVLADALRSQHLSPSQRPVADVALSLLAGDLYPLDLTRGLPGLDEHSLQLITAALTHLSGQDQSRE